MHGVVGGVGCDRVDHESEGVWLGGLMGWAGMVADEMG